MKRTLIITAIVFAVITIAMIIFNKVASKSNKDNTFTEAKRGLFEITVSNAGKLLAENAIDVMGPEINQNEQQGGGPGGGGLRGGGGGGRGGGGMMRAMNMKIQDIVAEGTIVKEGDYIAQLDRSDYTNTLTEATQSLENLQNKLEMTILDTAVTLSSLRDEITNQRYIVQEAKITLDESKFEPPATRRKAEINLNKQQRALDQLIKNYSLRRAQALTDISTARKKLQDAQEYVASLQDFLNKFTVRAPKAGIVMYKEEFNGSKRKAGSTLNPFDMVVATMPDLTSMLSKVYVSEIEVNKVKVGQKAVMTIDALPGKTITGTVNTVANVGEVLPNSDAKMFEVLIKVDGTDSELRPEMTTWNKIIIKSINDAIYIPLECVHAGSDSIPYVIKKNKTKQIVVLGEENDKNVIVRQGLEEGTPIYVVPPDDFAKFRTVGQNLLATNQ
ncbi:MAG: HlyD family efflux transporter periplasmic adaptor subunit [Bacteroidales bacterium]|jgi:multidrug efflux pump subunit AcrA (membrane-fusion protein)|nr:HlyD family efflux transporter periplasmic adaptor subunit [Bacteroidales bacterium]OQB60903.1 MAG: macrolide transporter subunit MacA [Bacteroidetes bacterium ADurb.Bin145]HOU02406.1 efflux RND transporter periplasmic adaptor subunit [Bacteroidales bacterium]HQK68744.1 efflux RND transporter periplasmic adaptor subunit [Bacteroidales bacterium]